MTDTQWMEAILRTLTWAEVLGYAPTRVELLLTLDCGDETFAGADQFDQIVHRLLASQRIVERDGRLFFSESADALSRSIAERDPFQPRKRRRARRVARWLSMLPGVRAVCLANTTALGHARDEGDLDFFIVVRHGSIWTTRFFAALPFRLLRLTPRPGCERDAVCLSYFISDAGLDLSSHVLPGDDPYYRHWFLSLLPLIDDGVLSELWMVNAALRARFPFARKWIVSPDVRVNATKSMQGRVLNPPVQGIIRGNGDIGYFERLFRWMQMRWFPASIRERMNRDTTVMVSDTVLKFHTTDGRDAYRDAYRAACAQRGV